MKNLVKNIPILLTIVSAIVMYSWIAAQAYGRIMAVETTVNGMPERLARIEERIVFMQKQNDKIENKIDRIMNLKIR